MMTTAGWIALGITVFGAFSYATASILQAVAARRSSGTVETMRHPLYLLGILCDMLAWIGAIVALRELAVYVVESILAGSLAITVVAARIVLKSRLRGRDVTAVIVSVAALTVLAMSAGPQHDVVATTALRWSICAAALAMAVLGWSAARAAPAGVIAAMGGLCLGGAAMTGRALPRAPMDIVTDPLTAALLTFAVTGMLMYAHALGKGEVGPVTAIHWTAEVVAPSAVALLLLGDKVRTGWEVPAAAAVVVTIAAAVMLARAPASEAAAGEPLALECPLTPSIEAPPLPVLARAGIPVVAHRAGATGERIIWWGPPPIWRPPARPRPASQPAGRL
ncbi:hypothetical protein COUCH_32950 [Couchioplanes caeruleus]|uniref:hypothetical protein n=1 Tax=Couchioplanes caeruleus TaxID=56438 RepID=UPI0020BDDC86|nr:hypothetical protein [Couchioplanes caeruleus]UQU63750.1 hypothetical protein COUCH_32950 [Couchioplanes caeruleus]